MGSEVDGILAIITQGLADDNLDAIRSAVNAREDFIGAQKALTMLPGTRVEFNEDFRPKYAVGLRGTVEGNERGKLKIRVDSGYGKGSGVTWRVDNATILDVIEEVA